MRAALLCPPLYRLTRKLFARLRRNPVYNHRTENNDEFIADDSGHNNVGSAD